MDNITPEQRRKNMRNIRSKWTKCELMIASELKRNKIYRRLFAYEIVRQLDDDAIIDTKRAVIPDEGNKNKMKTITWTNKMNQNKHSRVQIQQVCRIAQK